MSDQGQRPEFVPPDPQPGGFADPTHDQRAPGMQPGASAPPAANRPARRRRWLPVCITLAVVLVLLVAVDRIAPRVIGDRIGETLQAVLETPEQPQVTFGGFPFLTQLATSHYRRVTMTARDVPIPDPRGREVSFSIVRGQLTGVDARNGYRTVQVERFTGSATIGYPALSELVGVPISHHGQGPGPARIRIQLPASIIVTAVPVFDQATGRLGLADPRIEVAGREISAEGVQSMLDQRLNLTLPALIPGVAITDVRAGPDGLTLSGAGDNLTLRR